MIGNIHLFNLFTPLILKGQAKKVIAISSGQADLDLISKFSIDLAAAYTISKTGLNAAVAKFSAQYAKDGVLFMSICPGMVETGQFAGGMLLSLWNTYMSDNIVCCSNRGADERLVGDVGQVC